MRTWLLNYLCCPACGGKITSIPIEQSQPSSIDEGVLVCDDQNCRHWYPVSQGIPRMLPSKLIKKVWETFVNRHEEFLNQNHLLEGPISGDPDQLKELKQQTIKNFGFEWKEFDRFGWDDPVYNKDFEKEIFFRKTLTSPDEMKNKVVLDAGCGNGRYCYWGSRYAQKIIGIDLGDGVESANRNLASEENVGIVQADIFYPPFPDNTFDIIYSIGVLMHTGDAHKATHALAMKVKGGGGSLTVHVYGKGNCIYEFFDKKIRNRTTKMSIDELQRFTRRAFAARKILEKIALAEIVNLFIKLDPHPHCIFDWYAAPIATHHTYKEVTKWFEEIGFLIIKTNQNKIFLSPRTTTKNKTLLAIIYGIKKIVSRLENIPVTVRAKKP